MIYAIDILLTAQKQLARIERAQQKRIIEAIRSLAANSIRLRPLRRV